MKVEAKNNIKHSARTKKASLCRRLFNMLLTSNNYYKAVQPMFFFTFIYGITPFRVATDRFGCKTLKTSWFGYINPILHIIAFAYSYAYTLYHNESLIGYFLRTDISNFGNKLHVISGLLGATVCYVSAVIRKNKLLYAIRMFIKVDRNFELIRAPRNYTAILRYILSVLSVVTILDVGITTICYHCLREMDVHPSPYLSFIFLAELLGISVSISLFCLLTRSVSKRCALLNKVCQVNTGSVHHMD